MCSEENNKMTLCGVVSGGVKNCNASFLSPTVYTRTAYEGYMEWIQKHTTAAGVAFPIPTLSIIIFVVSVSMGI